MEVIIDGVVYVPKTEVPELTDERLKRCLRVLTEMRYFNQSQKMMGLAWNAINELAPDIAELETDAAYDLLHSD